MTDKFLNIIKIELFSGKLNTDQINGISTIIDRWSNLGDGDNRKLAYILATVFHETGHRMQPVKEFGGEVYLKSKKYYPYYGRDLAQTTWKANYEKVKNFSGIDVVNHPDLIGQMPLSADVAIIFVLKGWYTGKKLKDYINNTTTDYINARRIINSKDKAEIIAKYAEIFYKALS